MSIGIYKIILGEYYYIGSSNNISRRITKHLQHLRENKHINPFLQNVYNKHSREWKVEVLEEVVEQDLLTVEQKYLDIYYGKDGCLNLVPTANKPPSSKGRKWKPSSIKKMSKSKLGWKPSKETIKTMCLAARKRCMNPQVIENMKIAFRNRPKKLNPFYLIYNNNKQGPFYSSKECKEKTDCPIGVASIYLLCKGRYKYIKGCSVEILTSA